MLSREDVANGVGMLAAVFRRKVSTDMVAVYHRVLGGHLYPDQFEAAVQSILEHEQSFPSPATILAFGRARSRSRAELGEPYLKGSETSLREMLEHVQDSARPAPSFEGQFASTVERLEYEDAAVTVKPPDGRATDPDWSLKYVQAIAAKAEANMAKIRKVEAQLGGR